MADQDHNRSNNTGTGAKTLDRDAEGPTPAQGGSAGGGMAREVGQRDEEKSAFEDAGDGRDPSVTAVRKGDKANDGDMPNLPNRDGGGQSDHVAPKRTG